MSLCCLLQKLYAVCDLALGLMNVRTNITLKDSNVEPPLPAKLFTQADKVSRAAHRSV